MTLELRWDHGTRVEGKSGTITVADDVNTLGMLLNSENLISK
mgnify:CR=1 FL=1